MLIVSWFIQNPVPENTSQKNAEKMGADFALVVTIRNCTNCLLAYVAALSANTAFTTSQADGSIMAD